ncbi:MAG: DUF3795 domain-containing protein [Methanobrevibacter thaueri]|uniref:DUF3795 domain-containing protein n=1 Tax=Methanobrevibacter thaueri TaxID=190975 RepID=UPI0026F2EE83|nr:DUF3795 domain-containing protein [Methanobrevibacter thaueri]MBE6495669.1 DUF3795 domain-containing protein [Methanobrevibacter thaueri]
MTNTFGRVDDLFSLCGLNCSLCPLFIRENCPGCRAGSPCAEVCEFAPCSVEHGDLTYCYECEEYPCPKYDGVDEHDSLMSHRNQKTDMIKAKTMGIEKYHEEQLAKKEILDCLLREYDNGRRDVFFCMTVNLLDLEDLKIIIEKADGSTAEMELDDKSDYMKSLLIECGQKRNIELKLRRDGYYG